MPKTKNSVPLSDPEKVRLTVETMERCKKAWASSIYRDRPFSEFLRHIVEIGANVYEKQVKPIEDGSGPPPELPDAHISGRGTDEQAV